MTLDEFVADVLESVRAEMQCVRGPDGDVQPAVYRLRADGSVRRFKLPWEMFHFTGLMIDPIRRGMA